MRPSAALSAVVLLVSLCLCLAACARTLQVPPGVLSEGEFRLLRQEGAAKHTNVQNVHLTQAQLRAVVRIIQQNQLSPVYRGYLWLIARCNLKSVSPEEARRLWFINREQIDRALLKKGYYRALLRRDEEFWRDLQAMTGLRIAIDHVAEQLYDGSTESTLEFNKAPFLTFMDWGVRLFGCDARCAIGFGSIYITTGTWLVSTLPWGAYDRYRAAYESGAAGGLAPPH